MAKYKVGDIVSYNSQKYQVCWCSSETSACNYCVFWDKSACFGHCKNCVNIIGTHTYYKKLENMEQPKEIKIQVPEGMEIDKENSTFECIKFKPKSITYESIQKEFKVINPDGRKRYQLEVECHRSHKDKLTVYRKLLEVADYLNGEYNPNWQDSTGKFNIFGSFELNGNFKLEIISYVATSNGLPVFKTKSLAEQAIEIIGKDNLKILFQ